MVKFTEDFKIPRKKNPEGPTPEEQAYHEQIRLQEEAEKPEVEMVEIIDNPQEEDSKMNEN